MDDWIEQDHIPSLVDACLVEIKDYMENNGRERFGSLERMYRMKKFDAATSIKAENKAFEFGILDKDKYMYEGLR